MPDWVWIFKIFFFPSFVTNSWSENEINRILKIEIIISWLNEPLIDFSFKIRYLACGSNSGVVNIYKRTDFWSQRTPTPEKIVYNLTTSVSSIKFNPTSEILAMASEVKENAVKLLHMPSMTVFSNFPSFNYNFKRPNCIDFSLNGGFFSIGNNRGAANLYK